MNNRGLIFMIASQDDVIQSASSLSSLHPLLENTEKCTLFFFFSAFEMHRRNTNQEFMICLMSESSDGVFSEVSLGKPCFFTDPYICPTIKSSKRVCLITLGNYRFFAALLWSAGKFSKGDCECDWGVSSWHLWITKIVGAAGGATASNGSLIFLDVERRDPLPDSPQLEKACSAGRGDCK